MMRSTTGFHDDVAGRLVTEKPIKWRSGEPPPHGHVAVRISDGDFEYLLCEVHSDCRSMMVSSWFELMRLSPLGR